MSPEATERRFTPELDGVILGVSRRTYPRQARDGEPYAGDGWHPEGCSVLVVLVGGRIGDYAAYCGQGTPEWVAHNGDKLRFEEACCHFPGQLESECYRL
jgi:hypothetical protein